MTDAEMETAYRALIKVLINGNVEYFKDAVGDLSVGSIERLVRVAEREFPAYVRLVGDTVRGAHKSMEKDSRDYAEYLSTGGKMTREEFDAALRELGRQNAERIARQ